MERALTAKDVREIQHVLREPFREDCDFVPWFRQSSYPKAILSADPLNDHLLGQREFYESHHAPDPRATSPAPPT